MSTLPRQICLRQIPRNEAKTVTKMFPFITETCNPIGGECQHKCVYCWATKLAEKYNMAKYKGEPLLYPKELAKLKQYKETDTVFIGDMTDIFGEWVPSKFIQQIIDILFEVYRVNSQTQFLFLTKNPRRYFEFFFPPNVILGATIESEFDPSLYDKHVSDAPKTMERIRCMKGITENHKFISIEPILDFSLGAFLEAITDIKPEFIAVGFDNYNNHLPEPESLERVEELIKTIEKTGIKVYRKTMREPSQ